MSQHFNPRTVLRQVSNALLRQFFEQDRGHQFNVPWDKLRVTQIEGIFDAWQKLPDTERRDIDTLLQAVSLLADVEGIRVIIENADRLELDLRADLEQFDSRYDKAMWTYLTHRRVWDDSVRFAHADRLSTTRYWVRRKGVPKSTPNTSDDYLRKLETALSAFYINAQGRGHRCKVEHQLRGDFHYYFAYIDNYAETHPNFKDNSNDFVRTPIRLTFENVFVYQADTELLEMYATGGKRKVVEPLQEIFCREILDARLAPEDIDDPPFQLQELLQSDFQFDTDPGDRIVETRVRKLRVRIKGAPRRRIVLHADPDSTPNDIYVMLDRYLDKEALPKSLLDVDQVTLSMKVEPPGGGRPKVLTFDISTPHSSNLRSQKKEDLRLLAEKYLKKWKIDCA